jgi:hypothetical protein
MKLSFADKMNLTTIVCSTIVQVSPMDILLFSQRNAHPGQRR